MSFPRVKFRSHFPLQQATVARGECAFGEMVRSLVVFVIPPFVCMLVNKKQLMIQLFTRKTLKTSLLCVVNRIFFNFMFDFKVLSIQIYLLFF
jgi:large-conductance mechanosensitive channel